MSELTPLPFANLVTRLYAEAARDDALFNLPRAKWFLPDPVAPDFSVSLHGKRVGNLAGPAAGPHTQMAQNLLLAYAAGARILELKTVQRNDRLTIPRPCIDMATIGYNVEWSQELRLEHSLREYVAGAMLIELFRRDPAFSQNTLNGTAGNFLFDMSVGYDLAGIQSDPISRFLDGLRDASSTIATLRDQIPAAHAYARDFPFPTSLSHSVTLSTFHGCPAEEIERIAEHLILNKDLDVIIKMNPPMLGRQRLEHFLHDVLGYTDLQVPDHAYTSGLQFPDAVQLVHRLSCLAASRGRHFGCKFSNTLEVLNHRSVFTPDNKFQYLSGQPLHVLTMALTADFREAVGEQIPISFSAGIDRHNFAHAVACGFVPVSVCSDLLRPGGYARIGGYLHELAQAMNALDVRTIPDFIHAYARSHGHISSTNAHLHNTRTVAALAQANPRYRAAQNSKPPKRLASQLTTFDCLTCDKCITVCPNAANVTYPAPKVDLPTQQLTIHPDGTFSHSPGRPFHLAHDTQIANLANFCNDCGNCDTFCPELGGPYLRKPRLFLSAEAFHASTPRDGCYITPDHASITARLDGTLFTLIIRTPALLFTTQGVEIALASDDFRILSVRRLPHAPAADLSIDLWHAHALHTLLQGLSQTSLIPS